MSTAGPPSASLVSNRCRRFLLARQTNPTAFWFLVFSVVWIAGVGSLIGLVLGVTSVRKSKASEDRQDASGTAYTGIIVGMVGVVLAAFMWTHVTGIDATTSSPSYIDGSNFAANQYSNATSEASLCVASNAQSYDNPTQWLLGCRDGWAIATHSFDNPGMPGLNVG